MEAKTDVYVGVGLGAMAFKSHNWKLKHRNIFVYLLEKYTLNPTIGS